MYPRPARSIEMPGKDAAPSTAFTVVVPDSVPPPGLFRIESVIGAVEVGIGFPSPSRTCTTTGEADGSNVTVVIAVATWALAGCDANTNPRWQVPVRVVVRELCAWFNVDRCRGRR